MTRKRPVVNPDSREARLSWRKALFYRYLYFNYRTFYAVKVWLQHNVTQAGAFALAGAVAAGAVGIDTNRAVAYQAFSFLICLILIAFLTRRFSRKRFTARRVLPKFGTAGTPLKYKIFLSCDSPKTERGFSLLEIFRDPRPSFQEFALTKEPGEEERNWFDRRYKYYRWQWLLRRNRIARAKRTQCPFLPAGEETEISMEIFPRRRGILRFEKLAVVCPDPLGLFNALVKIPVPDSVVILPKRYPIPHVALPGTLKYQQGGVALASSIGESEEFVSLRDYRPGDSTRRIHWKSWAKTGGPIVKEYQDEFFVRHALILDTFGNGIEEEVFEEAVSTAASFACTAQTQESLLDLLFVGSEAYCFTTGRSLGQSEQMLEVLASVTPCVDKPFGSLRQLVLGHLRDVSGCIAIFLTWDSDRAELVRLLDNLGMPMLVLIVCCPGEKNRIHAEYDPLPANVRFIETGKVAEQLAGL